jgi:kynurenine formamidase
MGVHATTHMDAPWHYAPECGGKPAKTVDEIPLEWCTGPGIVINMAHKKDNEFITKKDIESFLHKNSLSIAPGTIVLIKTGRDRFMGTPNFFSKGTGMSADATEYLIDKGVKVMGIDQWGWDLPMKHMVATAKENGDRDVFWQAHLVGREKEYCHMEQLTNLDQLPMTGFTVMAFPLKREGASGAPARVVAILDSPVRAQDLAELQTKYPRILSEVRGKGLLIGMEFETDEIGYKVASGLFSRQVITAGTLINSKNIRIEPALNIPYELIDEVLSRLEDTFKTI